MEHHHLLVFPAASRPNIRRRISFDPKIFPMILETWPPIVDVVRQRRRSNWCIADTSRGAESTDASEGYK